MSAGHLCCGVYPGHHAGCRKVRHVAHHMAQISSTRWTECVTCDGTGSFPDITHPCRNCGGLGEVEFIPFPIQRKDG